MLAMHAFETHCVRFPVCTWSLNPGVVNMYMGLVAQLVHEGVEHVLVLISEAWGVLALGLWGDRPTCQLGI